jgi:ketol-acid reductoisomerase
VDAILVAPRIPVAGVRERYRTREGFYPFIGVHQGHSGQAKELALALAKGIGSTRGGFAGEGTCPLEEGFESFSPPAGQAPSTPVWV